MTSRITEITLALDLGHKGHFNAESALSKSGVIPPEGVKGFEIDRKRLYEDNESFDARVEDVPGGERVVYERTGPQNAQLSIIIYFHYHPEAIRD
jgi:hypothetical protein